MTEALVSVVIPTYNYGHFVTDAVDSALAQTYPALEVIVVDDGSTDDTRLRLEPYLGRIRYIYKENQGLSAARNTGISEATGDYIALLDSDDCFHPGKLACQMAHLLARPQIGLMATACTHDPDSRWAELGPDLPGTHPVPLEAIVLKTRFGPSSVVVRKHCFQSVGMFDTSLRSVEDRDMWIRIGSQYQVEMVDFPLVLSRVHSSSMSRNAEPMERFEYEVLMRAFSLPALRKQYWLRRRALSLASFAAALRYRDARLLGRSFLRAVRSLLLWPFKHKRDEIGTPLARIKFICLLPKFYLRKWSGSQRNPNAPHASPQVASKDVRIMEDLK